MKTKNLISALSISSFLLAICLSVSCSQEKQPAEIEKKVEKVVEEKVERSAPPRKTDLGTHIVDGWTIDVARYRRKNSDMLDVTINPPKGVDDKASVTRIWMGDKNSESLKTKMSGHGHGDYEMHYDINVKFEEGDDKTQFSLDIETEKGKTLFKTIQL